MIELDLNGYTELPAGKIANVATLLELHTLPERRSAPRADVTLQRVDPVSLDWYLGLFRRIGERWLWFSRLAIPKEKLRAILDDERVLVWRVVRDGEEIGLVELDLRDMPSIELAFFGLIAEATGSGIGRWMMDETLVHAFSYRPQRVWVHTCTLDHPAALPFYMNCGFKPYKRAIEMADDPRLTGTLPKTAAPQVPIL